MFALCLVCGCRGERTPPDAEAQVKKGVERSTENGWGDDRLAIELRLPKDHYDTSETNDAEVVLRNVSEGAVKIPVWDGPAGRAFFAFLILGDKAAFQFTTYENTWYLGIPSPLQNEWVAYSTGSAASV